jgi:NADH-quinone oxidoreductase subunit F
MPAYEEEFTEAEREGVRLWTLVAPVEVLAANGQAVGLRCRRMTLGGYDLSGRRRPKALEEAEFDMEVDQVIAAIGQKLDVKACSNGVTIQENESGFVQVDPHSMQCSEPWVFSGGDAVTGPASVVAAIGAGEQAAIGIDRFLSGEEHAFWREQPQVDTAFDPLAEPSMTPRAEADLLPVAARASSFDEVELPLEESKAICEALRCLRCDYCATK